MDYKLLAIIATLAAASTYLTIDHTEVNNMTEKFAAFKVREGKSYATAEEEAYRFAVYVSNMQSINEHNAKEGKTYTKGENLFTDLTKEEFKRAYLGGNKQEAATGPVFTSETSVGSVNWVTKGKVQRVKNQGQCGSCWAFSAVATTESADAIFGSQLGDFSEQELVDCCKTGGCAGCGGGWMNDGVQYLASNGICTESSYPYQGVDGTCQVSSCTKSSFTISGVQNIAASVSALQAACDKQPVSVGCDASAWSSYSSGIFSDCGTSIDHGILLAGYTSQYWLIKNSWGASWGENGYIRLTGDADTCGVLDSACVPTL